MDEKFDTKAMKTFDLPNKDVIAEVEHLQAAGVEGLHDETIDHNRVCSVVCEMIVKNNGDYGKHNNSSNEPTIDDHDYAILFESLSDGFKEVRIRCCIYSLRATYFL